MDEKGIQEMHITLLGNIPIDLELRQGGDAGVPLMASAPDSEVGRVFQMLAKEFVGIIENHN